MTLVSATFPWKIRTLLNPSYRSIHLQPLSVSCHSFAGTLYQSLYSHHSFIHLIQTSCALYPSSYLFLFTRFLISSPVCLFLSQTLYCFSCSPHLTQPLFLCPPLYRNNGLLTAFQLPQGLRGRDGCRMLMSKQHQAAAHTAQRREGWRSSEMRLCQSDTEGRKSRSHKGYLFQWLKSASSTHTPLPHHTPSVRLLYLYILTSFHPAVKMMMVGLTHAIYVSDRREVVEMIPALFMSLMTCLCFTGWGLHWQLHFNILEDKNTEWHLNDHRSDIRNSKKHP